MTHAVVSPVIDLRREPQELMPRDYSHHRLRDSQLLYGETVRVLHTQGEWLFVEALEQEKYSEERSWHFYPGWVQRREIAPLISELLPNVVVVAPWVKIEPLGLNLSFGTYLHLGADERILLPDGRHGWCTSSALRPLSRSIDREQLVRDAAHFLGAPYLWGGRGAYSEPHHSSADCSGLTNLLYRAQGVQIPRDAHDQFLKARKIAPTELQQGDLIFLSRSSRITHVILYNDPLSFIEAPETGKKIHQLCFTSPLSENLQIPGRPYTYHAHFGTFIS